MPSTESPVDAIKRIERDRLDALVTADVDRARAVHSDDYQLINPAGATWSREQYLGGIASGELRYHRFQPDGDVAVRFHGTVAVVRYIAAIDIAFPGGGDADRFWHTDLYELRDGRWQVVWSQATRIT